MTELIILFAGFFALFICIRLIRNKEFLENYVKMSPKAYLWRKVLGEDKAVNIIRKIFAPLGILAGCFFIVLGLSNFITMLENRNNEITMNDFASVGFVQNKSFDLRAYKELIELAAKKGEWIEVPEGYYIKLADQSGAEVWAQADKDKKLIGGHPYFNGKSKNKFSFNPFVGSKYSELDGSIYSHIRVGETDQDYPLIFDIPNFYTNTDYKDGDEIEVQITAFPKEFEIYENYQEYTSKNGDSFAEEALVPIGTFSLDGSEKEPEALALFTGNIREVKQLTNQSTGQKFFHLLVKTLSAEYDVVIASDLLKNTPKGGKFITGIFWMTGKIL